MNASEVFAVNAAVERTLMRHEVAEEKIPALLIDLQREVQQALIAARIHAEYDAKWCA